MRSAIRLTLAAAILGMLALVPQGASAQVPVSTAEYQVADEGVVVTPVRSYRYGAYRPYYGSYGYRPYAAYRPYYGYRPYVRPYAAYRPYAYPYYGAYPPYYGYRSYYRPMPYYGGYYTYGRPGFSFGFGW
jgi:hypothetical protein